MILFVCNSPSWAEGKEFTFDIPFATGDIALKLFAKQSNIQIMYPYDVVKEIEMKGLKGEFTLQSGLNKLLKDTCLKANFFQENDLTDNQKQGVAVMEIRGCERKESFLSRGCVGGLGSLLMFLCAGESALAQEADAEKSQSFMRLEEIVVTAQKRSQSINEVPMSITAISAEGLSSQGIVSVDDLRKVVPSFNSSPTRFGTPVYTLRGVGFLESSLAATPTISVYVDEAPLPFSAMTRFGVHDLDRVEVLKGPQGTLFGQNSTGGAMNFIAAKPTEEFSAGVNASYGRFNDAEIGGFVSGALSSTLNARLSARTTQSDGWQKSTTRSDELGEKDQFVGRLLLDWTPTDRLNVGLNLNGWRDKSESLAPQAIGITTLTRDLCPIQSASCLPAYAADVPLKPSDPREADWDPGVNYDHDDKFYQGVGRIYFDLTDQLRLTSITSYAKYKQEFFNDHDGTQFVNTSAVSKGEIDSLFQEIRLALSTENGFEVVVGASYQKDEVDDYTNDNFVTDSSIVNLMSPDLPIYSFRSESISDITTRAIFGNVEYKMSDEVNLHAGLRYTDVEVDNKSCNADSGDGSNSYAFNSIVFGMTGSFGTTVPGGCVTLNSIYPDPTSPTGLAVTTGHVKQTLKEDNVSWRLGIDYTPRDGLMLYGNVSQGYKSGSFPNLGGTAAIQYSPATQEKVLAYEIGTKSTLSEGRIQLDAAAFYYDYSDKQVRGRVQDPLGIFGALEALVNVPDSRLYGAEVQISALLIDSLTIKAGVTYLNSEVTKDFYNFDPYGNSINFKGKSYPYTPTWSFIGDAEYNWEVGHGLNAFVGVSGYAQSAVVASFRDRGVIGATVSDPANLPGETISHNIQDISGYAVFDARAGLESTNGSWRVTAWVRNLDNRLYATNVSYAVDFTFRTVGMPRTYGVSASYQF